MRFGLLCLCSVTKTLLGFVACVAGSVLFADSCVYCGGRVGVSCSVAVAILLVCMSSVLADEVVFRTGLVFWFVAVVVVVGVEWASFVIRVSRVCAVVSV